MKKIILFSFLSCIIFVTSGSGQCNFPAYDKYGLVCDEARFLCGYEMDGYIGKLLDEKSPLPQPDPLCAGAGEADNIQWYSFVTDDVNVEIVISYSNCTGNILSPGLQVGIFEHCELDVDLSPLGSIYCIEGINYSDIIITPDPADIVAGQLYLLFVDGYAGSSCDFEIDVISGVCTDPPPTPTECEQDCGVIYSNADHKSCTFFQDTFLFDPGVQLNGNSSLCGGNPENPILDSIICVDWIIEPDTGFTIISESFEYFDSLGVVPSLVVEWAIEQDYLIKPVIHLNPLYSSCGGGCICTDEVAFSMSIAESTVVMLDKVELCPGECVDFCGSTYCDPGIQQCFDKDQCLIEVLTIVDKPLIEIDLGKLFLCPGDCYEFQGEMYCNSMDYTVSDTASCDTTYRFEIEDLDISISLLSDDDLLNCIISEAYLDVEWNTNFNGNILTAWISADGDTLTHGTEYTATVGGEYTFVAWADGYEDCVQTLNHSIFADDEIPSATLTPPFLDCNNAIDLIDVNTQDNIVSALWIGPNGYVSNDINAEVIEAGSYEVTFTALNGCVLTLSTEVNSDFDLPELDLEYDNWTCSEEIPSSQFSSSSVIESHQWNLPDGSNSISEILDLIHLGNYSLEVTGANGCKNQTTFEVADLSYDPSLELDEDRIWRCNDTEILLDLAGHQVQGLNYIWTNKEGAVISNSINLTIAAPGVYILITEDEKVSCFGRDTVMILEDPNPFADASLQTYAPNCDGESSGKIELISMHGGEGPYQFKINGASYADVAEISLPAGNYSLDIIDAYGCVVTKSIEIPKAPEFTVVLDGELDIRFGHRKNISFDSNLDDNEIAMIEWSNDQGDILGMQRELLFEAEETEFINLRVENLEGCSVFAQIKVNLSFEVDIYYPNVFSPNNDGNNDFFSLFNNGFPEIADDLKIFDRTGELVYKSSFTHFNDAQVGWDGTFNGDKCQPGVYVFILKYTLLNGENKTMSGTITLVR